MTNFRRNGAGRCGLRIHIEDVNVDPNDTPNFDPMVAMSPGLGMEGLQAFAVTRMSHASPGYARRPATSPPKKPRLLRVFRWSVAFLRRPTLVTRRRAFAR